MKRCTSFVWGVLLLAFGTLAAGRSAAADTEKTLEVRSIVRTHDAGYELKDAPGPSDVPKTPKADAEDAPHLKAKVMQIPKQEVSNAE